MPPKRLPRPALPDFRFETSYRRGIAPANGSWLWIAALTVRDQVMIPLTQGFVWALLLVGIKTWTTHSSLNGAAWGHALSVWWAGINGRA